MVEAMKIDDTNEKSENFSEKLREYLEKTIKIDIPPGPQCYCGDPRDFSEPEFQCSVCSQWFHHKCIAFDIGPSLPFMRAYHFMCKKCNTVGEEVFSKKQANFVNMCQTTLANLMCIHNGRIYFSEAREIIPFLESNWETLTTQPRKANDTWHTYIHKALTSNELFTAVEINPEFVVALACQDIDKIGPSYDQFRALTSQLKSKIDLPPPQNDASTRGDSSTILNASSTSMGDVSSRKGSIGVGLSRSGVIGNTDQQTGNERGNNMRSTRRSTAAGIGPHNGSGSFGASMAVDDSKTKVNSFGIPIDHPFNKEGYRYILVEPDPHASGRRLWDESEHTAGKPIPGYFYRVCLCPKVVLSLNDRAHQLKLHESQSIITGEKGYCMARATHSVYTGTWYFEAIITEQPEGSATRIGWSQQLGNLQAPCGYDKFSYSWRSRLGTVFHNSRGKHFADHGYTKGDVIGCLIHLPKQKGFLNMPASKPVSMGGKKSCDGASKKLGSQAANSIPDDVSLLNYLPEAYKDRPLIKFRNFYYFEEKDDPTAVEKKMRSLPESKIVFYRNGECVGTAFQDMYYGAYFPAVSIYKSATVNVNFGPDFKHPPSDCSNWIAMSERRQSAEIEQTVSDMVYLTDNYQLISRLIKDCAGE